MVHIPTIKDLIFPHHPDWVKTNQSVLEKREVFTYELKNKYFRFPGAYSTLPVCKNSFCAIAFPLLLYMGFSEIYLAGVDYSNNGEFFCKTDRTYGYISREFKEFKFLMDFAMTLPHAPKIFSVKSDNVKVVAKDGFINFSDISN